MIDKSLLPALLLGIVTACETGSTGEVSQTGELEPAGPTEPVAESTEEAVRIDSPETAEIVAAEVGVEGPFEETVHRNSEGETMPAYVQQAPLVVEVPEGAACGMTDAKGALLSCAPGTACIRANETAPGRCVAGPAAPPSEG